MAEKQDDGFHEIQLNGKQLVFLFMAATVVSVVIFLCGVLVGRGVRAERGVVAELGGEESPVPAQASESVANTTAPAGADPRNAAPPPAVDDFKYPNLLDNQKTPAGGTDEVRPSPRATAGSKATAKADAPAPPASQPPEVKAAVQAPAPGPVAAVPAQPPPAGFAVQIAALNQRAEADAIAKRLASKGYAAYVVAPSGGTPSVYRVRIGTFKTKREAESMAARLEKEEQFKPWITR